MTSTVAQTSDSSGVGGVDPASGVAGVSGGDEPVRTMRKDALRNRELLIAAGRQVFAHRGLEASLDDVARQAGVGVGTAYRHFANKYDLAAAIVGQALEDVRQSALDALDNPDPWAGLAGFLELTVERQAADRGLREIMTGVHDPEKSDEIYARVAPPIAALLLRAQNAGIVRADVSVTDLGCLIMMLCQIGDLGGSVSPDLWRRYLPSLLAGLRSDGPALPGVALTDEQYRAASGELHRLHRRSMSHPG